MYLVVGNELSDLYVHFYFNFPILFTVDLRMARLVRSQFRHVCARVSAPALCRSHADLPLDAAHLSRSDRVNRCQRGSHEKDHVDGE